MSHQRAEALADHIQQLVAELDAERTLREQTQQQLADTMQAFVDVREQLAAKDAQLAKGERVFQAVVYAFEGKPVPDDLADHGMVRRGQKHYEARLRSASPAPEPTLREALKESIQRCRGCDGRGSNWDRVLQADIDCEECGSMRAALASVSPPPQEGP